MNLCLLGVHTGDGVGSCKGREREEGLLTVKQCGEEKANITKNVSVSFHQVNSYASRQTERRFSFLVLFYNPVQTG